MKNSIAFQFGSMNARLLCNGHVAQRKPNRSLVPLAYFVSKTRETKLSRAVQMMIVKGLWMNIAHWIPVLSIVDDVQNESVASWHVGGNVVISKRFHFAIGVRHLLLCLLAASLLNRLWLIFFTKQSHCGDQKQRTRLYFFAHSNESV